MHGREQFVTAGGPAHHGPAGEKTVVLVGGEARQGEAEFSGFGQRQEFAGLFQCGVVLPHRDFGQSYRGVGFAFEDTFDSNFRFWIGDFDVRHGRGKRRLEIGSQPVALLPVLAVAAFDVAQDVAVAVVHGAQLQSADGEFVAAVHAEAYADPRYRACGRRIGAGDIVGVRRPPLGAGQFIEVPLDQMGVVELPHEERQRHDARSVEAVERQHRIFVYVDRTFGVEEYIGIDARGGDHVVVAAAFDRDVVGVGRPDGQFDRTRFGTRFGTRRGGPCDGVSGEQQQAACEVSEFHFFSSES